MKEAINSSRKTFRQKRFFELTGTMILLIVAVILLCTGAVLNPFYVKKIVKEEDILSAYKNHVSYVKLDDQTLDFTGYYKMNNKGNITYNCYMTTDYDTRYFVFLPVEQSVDKDDKTLEKVTGYNLIGRIRKDAQLFETVAGDYEVTSESFMEECNVSEIVIDEAGAKRKEVLIIWIALFTLLSSYGIYILVTLFNNRGTGGERDGENQA